MTTTTINFSDLFQKDLVFLDKEYKSREEFFEEFGSIMFEKEYVKESFLPEIMKREAAYPTGLETVCYGVAIPHTDPINLKKSFIAVIRPKKAVEFEPMGMAEGKIFAKMIFVLGIHKDGGQVLLLQKLMDMFMQENVMKEIVAIQDEEVMINKIKEFFGGEQ